MKALLGKALKYIQHDSQCLSVEKNPSKLKESFFNMKGREK